MGKKTLGILFLVGLGLSGITVALLLSETINFTPDSIIIIIISVAFGVFLMIYSGTKLIRRSDSL